MTHMPERHLFHSGPFALVPGRSDTQAMRNRPGAVRSQRVPGYSLLGGRYSRTQAVVALLTLVAGGVLAYVYTVLYPRSGDVSPDSVYGYGFAIGGTALALAVGISYVMRKRWRRQWAGRLNTMLAWHAAGGVLSLLLIMMHAVGNFNPRSGTYALYGLAALIVSGIIGRVLDWLCPLYAARAALQVLTTSGEERLDTLERQLRTTHSPERTRRLAPRQPRMSGIPWDMGYYELDPEIETIPALVGLGPGHAGKGGTAGPHDAGGFGVRSLSPGEVKRQARAIAWAMGREQFFIQLVRTWRRLHTLISLVFVGLLIWHLVYAAQLLMNAWGG